MKYYTGIISNIHYSLIDAMQGDKQHNFELKEALTIMCAPIVFFESSDEDDWKKKNLFYQFRKNLGSKFSKWRQYNQESLLTLIRQSDWMQELEDEEITELLDEFKSIVITDDNQVTLSEKMYETYSRMKNSAAPESLIKYGDLVYVEHKKKEERPKVYQLEHPVTDDDMSALDFYVNWCIRNWEFITECERYKWVEMACWRENFDLDCEDLAEMLKRATKKHYNLFDSSASYHPLADLYKLIKCDKERVRSLLRMLFDESRDLSTRVEEYANAMDTMAKQYWKQMAEKKEPSKYADARSISVMLMLNNPSKHYIYKSSMFRDFRDVTGIKIPLFGSTRGEKVWSCDLYCEDMRRQLMKFPELVRLNDKTYSDDLSDYHMMTQNFFYAIGELYRSFVKELPDTTELIPTYRLYNQRLITHEEFDKKVDELKLKYSGK